jgi:hypothetical protein
VYVAVIYATHMTAIRLKYMTAVEPKRRKTRIGPTCRPVCHRRDCSRRHSSIGAKYRYSWDLLSRLKLAYLGYASPIRIAPAGQFSTARDLTSKTPANDTSTAMGLRLLFCILRLQPSRDLGGRPGRAKFGPDLRRKALPCLILEAAALGRRELASADCLS